MPSIRLKLFLIGWLLSVWQPLTIPAQDSADMQMMHTDNFPHHWQIGDQTFQLRQRALDSLLTVSQIRDLARTDVDPPSDSLDNQIQQAGYFQPVVDEGESTDPNQDDVAEADQYLPVVTGATIYSSMKLAEIQEELNRQKEIVASDEQLGDAIKTARLQMLSSANEALLKINEFEKQLNTYQTEIEQLKDREQSSRASLENVIEPDEPVVYESTLSETLIKEIKTKRADLKTSKQKLQRLEQEIEFHTERVTKIPEERTRAKQSIEDARSETSRLIGESESADKKIALILQELRYRAAEKELKKLDVEVKRQEISARIDPLERDRVSRVVKRLEVEIESWEREIKKLRQKEVRREQRLASQATETAHWSIKPLAERNESLVSERKKVVEDLQFLRTEYQTITQQIESIVERRSDIQNKIEAAGLTGTNGMLLVDLRRTLATTGESHIRIRQLQSELRKVNLSKVSLIEERDELDDPLGAVKKLINSSEASESLTRKALQFVQTKREYLYQLIEDYQSYGRKVSEVSQARKKLIDEINSTLKYIDTNALWVRSSEPMTLASIKDAGDGLNQFFDSETWTEVAAGWQIRAVQRPYESTTAAAMLLFIVIFNRRIKNNIERSESNHE